ncbi:MAG TPA: class I SAM-dependent methyltransferase [Kineosporiaceae bacterium]|nr:class I SAM-dependent methyltransferase [Kineosporiaceae bacterium]
MSWRKYLLVPGLALTAPRRTPPAQAAWETYWSAVGRTGPEGDVLWDGAGADELAWWERTAREHLDPALPVVDVGCGNGRLTRLLAPVFPAAVGVDVSAAALEVAGRESQGVAGVSFRQLDVTAPGAGDLLARELGPVNVVVRGVLHVLGADERRRAAAELARALAGCGTLLLLETNWRGDLLGYLEHLGGRRGRLPAPLRRLIRFGLPRPAAFGPAELAATFRAGAWETVVSGPVDIAPVRTLGAAAGRSIPGFGAVLRTPPAAAPPAPGEDAAEQGM